MGMSPSAPGPWSRVLTHTIPSDPQISIFIPQTILTQGCEPALGLNFGREQSRRHFMPHVRHGGGVPRNSLSSCFLYPRRTPDPKLSTSPVLTAEFSLRWSGTWDPLLQCLHLDTPFLAQQNTKKLSGVKHCCVHAQLGQILDKRYKKTKECKCPF